LAVFLHKYFRLNVLEYDAYDSRTPENSGRLYMEYVKNTNKLTEYEHILFLSYIHLFLYFFIRSQHIVTPCRWVYVLLQRL